MFTPGILLAYIAFSIINQEMEPIFYITMALG